MKMMIMGMIFKGIIVMNKSGYLMKWNINDSNDDDDGNNIKLLTTTESHQLKEKKKGNVNKVKW